MRFQEAKRFVETLSYLKPVQIYGRIWHKSNLVSVSKTRLPKLRTPDTTRWHFPPSRRQSQFNYSQFTFLNEMYDIQEIGWDNKNISRLWRYNLHYFDDLNADNAIARSGLHAETIKRWIRGNPPFNGTGWEPYPTSLRIVNWLKWHFAGNVLSEAMRMSLALQVRSLHQRYEIHLQGNHLFANAKALLFAGLLFQSSEANQWRDKAVRVLLTQLEEQILDDGGHFELSPMYHAIVLEDCLDIINIIHTSNRTLPELEEKLHVKIPIMLEWLANMCHPDGEITFFNDAAFGVALSPDDIFDYAKRLGFAQLVSSSEKTSLLAASGYARVETKGICLIADVGKIGPDYLTGHAHADTLSFELSIGDERFVVNSGTSLYGTSAERQRQRSTVAHNTVCLNGKNSSDVWHGFRTGSRAYPKRVSFTQANGCQLEASHDGYAPNIHGRKWQATDDTITIEDTGLPHDGFAVSHLHLHPDIKITRARNAIECISPKGSRLSIFVEAGKPRLITKTWHPEFGLSIPNKSVEIRLVNGVSKIRMHWKTVEA